MTVTIEHTSAHISVAPPRPPQPARRHIYDAVKRYGKGDSEVFALAGVTTKFGTGRFTAIIGPSGSGKSTLLHNIAGLDSLTSGTVMIGDTDITRLDDRKLTQLRRDPDRFVQAFNLVPTLTAAEYALPARLAGRKPDKEWFDHVVETVGLQHRLGHRPVGTLRWPAATCRRGAGAGIAADIIFADEPTGNLDQRARCRDPVVHAQCRARVRPDDRDGHPRSDRRLVHGRAVYLADGRIVERASTTHTNSSSTAFVTSEADSDVHAHYQRASPGPQAATALDRLTVLLVWPSWPAPWCSPTAGAAGLGPGGCRPGSGTPMSSFRPRSISAMAARPAPRCHACSRRHSPAGRRPGGVADQRVRTTGRARQRHRRRPDQEPRVRTNWVTTT